MSSAAPPVPRAEATHTEDTRPEDTGAGSPRAETAAGRQVRSDIQALRALAVVLVVTYHLWDSALPGGFVGVDVFLVISGFLITTHLLAHPPRRARDLATFWSRRITRLLPAALLVLGVTLAASRLIAPPTRWEDTARDVGGAALYGVNWVFARDSVDYLAAGSAPSPVLHFWSLSVEEQFYLGWPIIVMALFAAGGALARRLNRGSLDTGVALGLAAVVAGSLAYSIHLTAAEPARAYFVTPTRVWELGAGGLLAALVARRAHRRRARKAPRRRAGAGQAMALAGLAAIAWAAWGYSSATPFPGWRALLPVLGALAIIAAAPGGALGRVLAGRPLQFLGDTSYSIYLWHWPLIVLVPYLQGGSLNTVDRLGILVATVALAAATTRYVENPLRRPHVRVPLPKPYAAAGLGMAAVLGLASIQVLQVHRQEAAAAEKLAGAVAAAQARSCFGAAALRDSGACAPPDRIVPDPAAAAQDRSFAYAYGCDTRPPFERFRTCVSGDRDADTEVALVGDSHAAQWLPALHQIGVEQHLKITTFLADRCVATSTPLRYSSPSLTRNCTRWSQWARDATSSGDFDLVVTAERTYRDLGRGAAAAYRKGYAGAVRQWLNAGHGVLAIRDTPVPGDKDGTPAACVAEHRRDLGACAGPRSRWLHPDPLAKAARSVDDQRAKVADLTDKLCRAKRCPAAVGGAMVYADASQLTATYTRSLAPDLTGRVLAALGRDGDSAAPTFRDCFGAAALSDPRCPRTTSGPVVPEPVQALEDRTDAWNGGRGNNCFGYQPTFASKRCVFGVEDPKAEIALVGNSHAGQYLSALQALAQRNQWRITTFLASRCAVAATPQPMRTAAGSAACSAWAQRTKNRVAAGNFDAVVFSNRMPSSSQNAFVDDRRPDYVAGYREVLSRWSQAGIPVLGIRDNPAPTDGGRGFAPECLAAHPGDFTACSGPRAQWQPHEALNDAVDGLDDTRQVVTVDMTDHICGPRVCDEAVGGVVVYFDDDHLTATYARTLAPYLAEPLRGLLQR